MTFEPGSLTTQHRPLRRAGVVAQAIMEKYEKLSLVRRDLEREHRTINDAIEQLRGRMRTVDSELAELRAALSEYSMNAAPAMMENEEAAWRREQHRFSQAQGKPPMVELFPETRQQKQLVIDEVRLILETLGSMHVRDIHGLLRTKNDDVPSVQRLSQILSESEIFEADRSKGWSLKEERPGFGRPGLSVSRTTPSGDGS